MSIKRTAFVLSCTLALAALSLQAQPTNGWKPNAVFGPTNAWLGDVAEIGVPGGFVFYDGKTTRALMKKVGEPVSGRELGLLMPTNRQWSVIFEFNDIGYVKDDEKDKLDADKILKSIIEGTNEANKERQAAGRPPLIVDGWEVPPKYDEATHNLEWAIRAHSGGENVLNYNTRLLGRRGVMETVLIVDPDDLQATLPQFRQLLADYKYRTGNSYAEYRPGDKIAEYGLGALILGGAAVGAAKLGLLGPLLVILKKFWVLIVAALAAVANFFKRTFKAFFGRPDKQ